MTDLVTRHCYSHENTKEFVMMSPHVMPRPIVSRIANMNLKFEREHRTRTLNANLKMNATVARRPRANETS